MLPDTLQFQGQPKIINFSQYLNARYYNSADTRFNLSAAISFDWIRHHDMERLTRFVNNINDEDRVTYINELQDFYVNSGIRVISDRAITIGFMTQEEMIFDNTISLDYIANEIMGHRGYIQIFRGSRGYEYFSPSYGSALFPTKDLFSNWFKHFIGMEVKNNSDQYYNWWSISKYEIMPMPHVENTRQLA